MKRFGDGRDWFFEKRFGLFVHWGLYSINEWHEQEMYRLGLSRKEYTPLMKKFNPVKFNPDKWLDAAEKAGMEYICFTSKHIDGFCMFDTKYTDYKVTNTPYGKDVLAMLANACAKRNFPLCIYYSVPDMNYKHYPNSGRGYELPAPEPGDEPDIKKYMQYVKDQVTELCTNYGKICGWWWDGNAFWGQTFNSDRLMNIQDESVNELLRSLQPGIIISNRGFDRGDYLIAEREHGEEISRDERLFKYPTEACQAIGRESWGYRRNEDYYSAAHIKKNICKVLARGGNYLLNAGPKSDGEFPREAVNMLEDIGGWYSKVKESFANAEPLSFMTTDAGVFFTKRGDILYVHLPNLITTGVAIKPIDVLPLKAAVLNTGRKPKISLDSMPRFYPDRKEYLHIYDIPVDKLSGEPAIIKLEFEKMPECLTEWTERQNSPQEGKWDFIPK
ncbi:MAG: alpha-L-fucosidase [Candidatus Omnitrophica bacterium]|nr:alpha-L-fucosidase [Candidatus Omnitrophota bacterium]